MNGATDKGDLGALGASLVNHPRSS